MEAKAQELNRRTDEGLTDWDTLYANNAALADGAGYQNVVGPDFEYGEGYVIRASTNNHMGWCCF